MKTAEIVVTSVEDVVRARLVCKLIHCTDIVDRSFGDMEECRHLRLDVIEGVYLDAALMFVELGPPKHGQTQVDGRGIKSIYAATEFEDVRNPFASCFRHKEVCKLLEDAADAVLVGFREIALGDMLAKAEMVALAAMSLDNDNQITQTLAIGQLSEHHHQQLVPAGEMFHITIAAVFPYEVIEMVSIQKSNKLSKNVFVLIHMQGYLLQRYKFKSVDSKNLYK